MAQDTKLEGTVVRKSSRDLLVGTSAGVLRCSLRGRFRAEGRAEARIVVGDRVLVAPLADGVGVIESVLPRKSELVRGTAEGQPVLVAANVDKLLVLIAGREPPPRWALVDRMLVTAERNGLEPGICINKWDQVLAGTDEARELEGWVATYRGLGYAVFTCSAAEKRGLEALTLWLEGAVTVVSGHSGVGKSTLLNALNPDLSILTGEVNEVTGKGRHTTTDVSLHPLPGGGFLADTPGFREFMPLDLAPAELGRFYRELLPLVAACRYADCLHRQEPRCAVLEAVRAGSVSKARYENYLQILETLLKLGG